MIAVIIFIATPSSHVCPDGLKPNDPRVNAARRVARHRVILRNVWSASGVLQIPCHPPTASNRVIRAIFSGFFEFGAPFWRFGRNRLRQ
jgi:hypothetical protein